MTEQELIAAAIEAQANAYAPYSNFKVGAALLTVTGKLFTGCNVENSSYGLSICAERSAICTMVTNRQLDIAKIVVVASPLASPCGACRQFIVEFGTEIEVVCVDPKAPADAKRWPITELIPSHFKF